MISASLGYTAIDAASGSVTVAPPPAYQAGDLLVMGVIAGGTSGAVAASAPDGWTDWSAGATPGLFTKTAGTDEPAAYLVSLAAPATAAVFTAAYPAAAVAGTQFAASGDDVTAYAPPFPDGVTAEQTVLLVAAAVASPVDVNRNAGYQNVSLPSAAGWATRVPVFGPALPGDLEGVYPVALGLAEVTGGADTPTLTSPQGCDIYAAYLGLEITGAAAPLTVTATAGYPAALPGLVLTVKALAGAASAAEITAGGATATFTAAGTARAPQASLTPRASGSLVYGAAAETSGVTGTTPVTPDAASTFTQNVADPANTCLYGTFQSAGPTTAGTPVTLGGTAPASASAAVALAEILAASGSTLTETAAAQASGTVPGDFGTTSVAQTAVFRAAPPADSLLVAMVAANARSGQGTASLAVTDSAGRTWTPLAEQTAPGYCGVWIGSPAG